MLTDPSVNWAYNVAKWISKEKGLEGEMIWYAVKDLHHLCLERGIHPPGVTGHTEEIEYKKAMGRTISKLASISNPVCAVPFLIHTMKGPITVRDFTGKVLKTKDAWQIGFTWKPNP